MNIRRIIATATVAGVIAALPITMIASGSLSAKVVSPTKVVSIQGGQGDWPLR